ncbi:GrpB family protein [Saccharospirillum mangrovi]|uniref:GrpB family protein n=1 Tax=Saccharospirillum mangrovi TaxID=2161747 RepID=UPI000D3D8A12|nr:GrpB family protein [Saccharospirillum mangrovi]
MAETADRIVIVEPKVEWPEEFNQLAMQLQQVLGALALRIDHIGSTAIPGLPAKDVIDIQITLADLNDDRAVRLLSAAGFNHRPLVQRDNLIGYTAEPKQLAKQFFREIPGMRRAHLHLREQGRLNQAYPLLMRDYLKAQPKVAQAYSAIKRELALYFADDANAYYAIKDPYMDSLYYAACLWHDSGRPVDKSSA